MLQGFRIFTRGTVGASIALAVLIAGAARAEAGCSDLARGAAVTANGEAARVVVREGAGSEGASTLGGVVLGTTDGASRVEMLFTIRQLSVDGGRTCTVIDRAALTVGFDGPVRVEVSPRYRPGSCEHEATRSHEMRHVALMEAAVRDGASAARAVVGGVVGGWWREGPVSREDATADVDRLLRSAASRIKADVDRQIRERNLQLDTPAEYRSVLDSCRNW
jgi:hypothetical protein